MTPAQTLDWLADQHFQQCQEERPVQDWIRKMKSQLPAPVQDEFPLRGILASELKCWHRLTEDEQINLLAFVKNTRPAVQRQWVGLMRGVRVEGETVVISVKGGNEGARALCAALIEEMNK